MHVQRILKMSRGLYTGGNLRQNTWKKAKENWGPYLQVQIQRGDRGSGPPLENHKLYGFL